MEQPIDNSFTAINTPVQAEKYFLPFLVSGEMDLTAIKKALREQHNFSEADVRITARVLSNANLKSAQNRSDAQGGYVELILGIVLAIAGIGLGLFLLDAGFIALLPLILLMTGALFIFKASKKIGKLKN